MTADHAHEHLAIEPRDGLLARLAVRQHGLLHVDDLASLGISPSTAARYRRSGRWTRERRAVVSISGVPPSFERVVAAALLGHRGDVFAAGRTAARLWPMPCDHGSDCIDLLTVTPTKARGPGIATHRTKLLLPADRTVVRGLPVTSYERTLVDISGRRDLTDKQLGWILDHGLREGLTTLERVRRTVARLPPAPGRRTTRIIGLLERRGVDFSPGASQREVELADWLQAAGLSRPVTGYTVTLEGVEWELDGAYPEHRVAFDYHSDRFHLGDGAIANAHKDMRKALVLKRAGWDYSSFGSQTTEMEVVTTIGLALARHQRSSA